MYPILDKVSATMEASKSSTATELLARTFQVRQLSRKASLSQRSVTIQPKTKLCGIGPRMRQWF